MRARIPSHDDEFLLVERLDLQPILRPAAFVARRLLLGDDAFVPTARRPLERFVAGRSKLLGEPHAAGWAAEELLQHGAALQIRPLAQIAAIEPDQIEHKDQLALVSLLQKLKSRRAVFIESDDFAVQD